MYTIQTPTDDRNELAGWNNDSLFGGRELVVVSNRQPYRHDKTDGELSVSRPTGGLTASLDPVMQRVGGTWIAWADGDVDDEYVDDDDCVGVPPEDPSYTLRRVWLSDEQVQNYYFGFSNRVLWPLCHSSLSTVRSKQSYWEQYKETNEQFAEVVSQEASDQAVIWLQDYHFALAPDHIRAAVGDDALLLHFWHIPWPSWDVFRACPHGKELLRGLLGNDLLGFHADRFCHNFLECVESALPNATVNWRTGTVSYQSETTRTRTIPIGVPFDDIQEQARSYDEFDEFRQSYGIDEDTKIAVSVERIDYSKGIPERLNALELLWERNPRWRGSVTHLMNCSESRSEIAAYSDVQQRVEKRVTQINERFGTPGWQPIVEVTDYLRQQELYGIYREADLCLVSPIRDGMNLITHEYIASQVDSDGMLVLSDQAGAHDLLGEPAISVSPHDTGQFADRLSKALTMPPQKRQDRMEQLRQIATTNDLHTWIDKHDAVARQVATERQRSKTSV